ncbi:MAG: hypothetical protein ABI239_05930 [Aquihabitans sp.]
MSTTAQDVLTRQIKRNIALGIAFCFALAMLMCLPAGIGWGEAAMVALLPAFFGGPFVGGLVTVISWVLAEERKGEIHGTAVAQAPVVARSIEVALPETIALPGMNMPIAATMASVPG